MFTRGYAVRERQERERSAGWLGKAFHAGAGRSEWVHAAIQELENGERAHRLGVWLDDPGSAEGEEGKRAVFRGEVWEEGVANEVAEWARLTIEKPLRLDSLRNGLTSEYELEGLPNGGIAGPELGMRRVAWIPVMAKQSLRGLVMLGSRDRKSILPRAKAEETAARFGLRLELEEERRLAAARKADLDFGLRVKNLIGEQQSSAMILSQLVESCTRGESVGGAGLVFAILGEIKNGPAKGSPKPAATQDHLLARAQSGEETWSFCVNGGPLEPLWREAVATRRVSGTAAPSLPLAKEIARIVALPVELEGKVAAVLLAGLPKRNATLETLDRLEWRAALAVEVLAEERRMHARAREQLWWKALLESSDEPVLLLNPAGGIAGASRGAREFLRGVSGDDTGLEYQPLASFFPEEQSDKLRDWLASGAPHAEGIKCDLRDGTAVSLNCLNVSGEKFSAVTLRPIRTAQESRPMEQPSETLQQAIEWLEEGVAVFGGNGEMLSRNLMFLQLLGLNTEEGRKLTTLEELISAASKNAAEPRLFADDWRALAGNGAEAVHEELAMKLPVVQTIERYARPITGPGGKVLGRVEVYRAASTARLLQSKMARAEKLATLGQRVTRIVHELNNPLTTILGNAQRMARREGTNGNSGEARQILQEAERASGIVRQLLNLPRESRTELEWVSLNEVVEKTLELQRNSLTARQIGLRLDMQEMLPRVKGDRGQLQQILLNLLQNAQQAMEESGRGSTLSVRTASAGNGRVKLEVQDDGPGIPEEIQQQIFDPFFTTKPPGQGTGLGLAIVSGFVRQHGGAITVDSRHGEGARFTVELPAAEEPWGGETGLSRLAGGALESIPFAANEKAPHILVVEDEPTVASLIADVLREEGMRVDVLPDGRGALEYARGTPFDLVVCDVRMPGMDGQDFFAALQEMESPLREHILFVTGDGVAARTQEFLAQHRLPHVAKPFRVEELSLAVRSLLGKSLQPVGTAGVLMQQSLGTGSGNDGKANSSE